MKVLRLTARTLGACFALAVILAGVGLFTASRLLERSLATPRLVNGSRIQVHNPAVTMFLSATADSAVIATADSRWLLVKPSAHLNEWKGWRPSGVAFRVQVDSMAVVLKTADTGAGKALKFPEALRFPVGLVASWRVMTVRFPGGGGVVVGPAHFASRGSQGVHGTFAVNVGGLSGGRKSAAKNTAPVLDASLDARWRGAALRYRLQAVRAGLDTLLISGIHEKRDLRAGFDSVHLRTARPSAWWNSFHTMAGADDTAVRVPPILTGISDVIVNAKADWRRDSLKVSGVFKSDSLKPFSAAAWKFTARLGPGGGRFTVNAAGLRQTMNLAGHWSQPHAWFDAPQWSAWRGEIAGSFRGGTWAIGNFELPLNFDVPQARLDTGLRVTARVQTPDATRIDLIWSGRVPGRLELLGTLGSKEPWAVAWTRDQISYESAKVDGVWEHGLLDITARVQKPKAYGAVADSLLAENRVTSTGYFLKQGFIHRDGELFTGSGQVLWTNAKGEHEVTLGFEALHPRDGRAAVAMHVPGPLELRADSLRPARFPYEPLRRFAAFDPWIDGRFFWNHIRGDGSILAHGRIRDDGGVDTNGHARFDIDLDAQWSRDSVRVRHAQLASGAARLTGTAVLPFDGRALRGLVRVEDLMGGSWNLRASSLDVGEVVSFLQRSPDKRPLRAVLNGELGFTPAHGVAGVLRIDSLHLPERVGLADVTALEILGMGDSVRAQAVVPHRLTARWYDTLSAVFTRVNADTPGVRLDARSTSGFAARFIGDLPGWSMVRGTLNAEGRFPLGHSVGESQGSLEGLRASGRLRGPLRRNFIESLELTQGLFTFRHASVHDTQTVSGTPALASGILRIPDLTVQGPQGEPLRGQLEYDTERDEVRAELSGTQYSLILPGGERIRAQQVGAVLKWTRERGLTASAEARNGFMVLPTSPYRVETGFERVFATVTVPPTHAAAAPTLKVDGRLHDFLFQRKWGWRDATSFFTGFARSGSRTAASSKRTRPWDLDLNLDAVGPRNRIDTDVLRMTFAGDARITGAYPYLLVNGKMSGLQGEVGQTRQSYALRDFEVKWDNVTIEDGLLHVEGEKRVRADCRADTRQTCQIYIRLDGRLEDVGFTYETDCAQNTGDPVAPSVLINSMAQGCYAAETPGGEGNYGSAAFAMLEPALNDRLSRGVARGSGGFIKSTQVSGLGALLGSDSSGLESVALEVESRSMYRTSLKGRAGYHPETKLANPMEYRLAAEYRPPLERMAEDSVWRARLRNRFTLEAAVETRPEGRDIEEERRVRQRAGLRYRHRFWNLW